MTDPLDDGPNETDRDDPTNRAGSGTSDRHERPLCRPVQGRIFGGVAEGVARYTDIDVSIVRVAIAVLALLGGTGVLAYVAAWLLIPEEGAETSLLEEWLHGLHPAGHLHTEGANR
jgi:phage shock protein PspC (stress-responsive transcriptional regulator)